MTRSTALIGGLTVVLAGCAGIPIVYHRHVTTYAPGEFAYAGNLYLDVRGNPYNVPKEQLQEALAEAMSGGIWGTPVEFVTKRPEPTTSPYKVVMVFDAPWYASYDRMCQQPDTIEPLAAAGGYTRLTAALCRSDTTISYVYAGFGSGGPADPAFRRAIQQIELALLPPRNEHIDQNGGDSSPRR
jgi:hypothetical protein